MKRIATIILVLLGFAAWTQPQKINYQAVALNAAGTPVKNKVISVRLSMVDSAATGTVLYTETHQPTTDGSGQFSVYLGGGTATQGTFANIPWGNNKDKFLKAEADLAGGSSYSLMGISQVVSVPYALAAKSAQVSKELEIGTIVRGLNGETYSLAIGTSGPVWMCNPPITEANAGPDQLNICSKTVTLTGNTPTNGAVSWKIISGNGGNLSSINSANTSFSGLAGNSYNLQYSVSNSCGISTDYVQLYFTPNITIASAGLDQQLYTSNITGNVVSLSANNPATGENANWTIIKGSGAKISSLSNPITNFTQGIDSNYLLVWTITNSCETSQDTVSISFPFLNVMNIPCSDPLVTYAGETYPTVQIGTQCWFQRNLNVGSMINSANDQTNNGILEKFCYDNLTTNCDTFGGLYQWAEAMQYQNNRSNTTSPSPFYSGKIQGICPTGWHVPLQDEFCILTKFLDTLSFCNFSYTWNTDLGGKMKSTSNLWMAPNTGATNSSGFSALPSGMIETNNNTYYKYSGTNFWTASDYPLDAGCYLGLDRSVSGYEFGTSYKVSAFSVRCIRD